MMFCTFCGMQFVVKTKVCRECQQELPATSFYAGRAVCKPCICAARVRERVTWTPEQRAAATARSRAYRQRDPERANEANRRSVAKQKAADPVGYAARECAKTKKHQRKKRALIAAAKDVPCAVCGVEYPPRAMDLHHRDPSTKSFVLSQVDKWRMGELQAELAKCDVLCSNCHRVHHGH